MPRSSACTIGSRSNTVGRCSALQEGDNQAKHRERLRMGVEVRSRTYGGGVFPPNSAPAWEHPAGPVVDGSIVSKVTFAGPADGVELDERVGLAAMVYDGSGQAESSALTVRDLLGGARMAAVLAFHEVAHARPRSVVVARS